MRIKITFNVSGTRQVLPLNYQYPLSAWIYKVLEKGDSEFSAFLHEAGYQLENQKTFKLFTFSNLLFPPRGFRILKGTDRMEITSREVSLIIAFMLPDAMQNFVSGLFRDQQAEIGDKVSSVKMQVANIEMLPEPEFTDNMRIKTLSPVVIASNDADDKYEQYLDPHHADYVYLFFKNLTDKHHVWQQHAVQEPTDFDPAMLKFRCLTEHPKSRLQTIKANTEAQVRVRGFLYDFEITAPASLIKTGYDSGFGAMNATGFGCGEVTD
jgi:CRISPR-associated endoribonuclease Cas6